MPPQAAAFSSRFDHLKATKHRARTQTKLPSAAPSIPCSTLLYHNAIPNCNLFASPKHPKQKFRSTGAVFRSTPSSGFFPFHPCALSDHVCLDRPVPCFDRPNAGKTLELTHIPRVSQLGSSSVAPGWRRASLTSRIHSVHFIKKANA